MSMMSLMTLKGLDEHEIAVRRFRDLADEALDVHMLVDMYRCPQKHYIHKIILSELYLLPTIT